MRGGSGAGGQMSETGEPEGGGVRTLEHAAKRSKTLNERSIFMRSKKAFQPNEEHMLLAFFVVQEQFVFVIVAGIKIQFAEGVLNRRANRRQDLVNSIAPAVGNASIRIKP